MPDAIEAIEEPQQTLQVKDTRHLMWCAALTYSSCHYQAISLVGSSDRNFICLLQSFGHIAHRSIVFKHCIINCISNMPEGMQVHIQIKHSI